MKSLPKCILMPLEDGTFPSHSLTFLKNLYPDHGLLKIILCYFMPPLPPVYQERSTSPDLERKRQQVLKGRTARSREALQQLKIRLMEEGFSREAIEEHTAERAVSVARQTCMLADIKQVDAVILERQMTSSLEAYLKGDLTPALLRHCLVSPLWFVEGPADTCRIAICLDRGEEALRAVDHCAFMLQDTATEIVLVRLSSVLKEPWISGPSGPQGRQEDHSSMMGEVESHGEVGLVEKAVKILREHAIEDRRISLHMLPRKGRASEQLLTHCKQNRIGILALGHSPPHGLWSFLKRPLTMEILNDMKNMALWAVQ